MTTVRSLTLLALISLLFGCGFAPLYARGSSGQPGPVQREMAAVSVNVISDRPGQLLRQALQERLEGAGSGRLKRYALAVDYGISGEGIGIRQDTTVTRLRLVGRARWTLVSEDPGRVELTRDQVRAVDDFNILNEQYFASDLDTEAAQRRLAVTLADQITSQLATFFRRRADAAIALR